MSAETRSVLTAPENEIMPSLAEMITHNQREWRSRKKGLALTSPIEVTPSRWILGTSALSRVFDRYDEFIHPAHKDHPPIIGLSVLGDTTFLNPERSFYLYSPLFMGERIWQFEETNTIWLTSVALGKDPASVLKKRKIEDPSRRLLSLIPTEGIEETTRAIASFQFTGNTAGINSLLQESSWGKEPAYSLEEWVKLNNNSDEARSKVVMETRVKQADLSGSLGWRSKVRLAKIAAGIHLRTLISLSGSHVLMGVINLYLDSDPTNIWSLSSTVVHETIHCLSGTDEISHGFPINIVKS